MSTTVDRLEFDYDDRIAASEAIDLITEWIRYGDISKTEWDTIRTSIEEMTPRVVIGPPFADFLPLVEEKNTAVTNVSATPNGTDCTVTWNSGIPTDSIVAYGLDTTYGAAGVDPANTTDHSVFLSDLTPDTLYHYKVGDSVGGAQSPDATFTTTAPV